MANRPAQVKTQPNNPDANPCCACQGIFPNQTMVKVKRQWYCTNKSLEYLKSIGIPEGNEGCKERMERYELWPPLEKQKVS